MNDESRDSYSVNINRRDGIIEITGPDKEWVAEQFAAALQNEDAAPPAQARSTSTGSRSADGRKRAASPKAQTTDTGGSRKRASGGRAARVSELAQKLTKEVKAALQQYRDDREAVWKPHGNQAAIIATFLLDNLDVDAVGPNELYTVYNIMGWEAPSNFNMQIENAQRRNGFFGGSVEGKAPLSHKGENFARHKALSGD